jgi:hypothetical protein
MLTTERADPADMATEQEALAVLPRLAAKGSCAAPVAGADFGVYSPREGEAQPIATLSAAAVALAARRGWLALEPGSDRYRIAAAGIVALRRAKSAPSAGAATVRSRPKPIRKAGPPRPERLGQEGPMAWLRRRRDRDGQRLITEPQFDAGERLAADFRRAQLTPRVTADWSAPIASRRMRRAAPGTGAELSDKVAAARTRVHRALTAVGPELAGILIDVCCLEVGLEAAERAQRWPQRAGKVVLQMALTGLARHYGLLPPAQPPGAQRLRHWGSDDYRPTLDAWQP